MKLIEPTMEYDKQIQAYRQEFLTFGGSMDGCGSLRKFDRTIDKVLISCVAGNEGSRKVIVNNGGIYESTVYEPEKGVYLERYWITIPN